VKRYSRVEDVVTIGSHPLLIPPIRAEHCYPAAAVRHSGYLPYIGGPWLQAHSQSACYERTIHCILAPRNTPWRVFSAYGECPVLHLTEKREGPEHHYGSGPELSDLPRIKAKFADLTLYEVG
jgi:hypothetical protein